MLGISSRLRRPGRRPGASPALVLPAFLAFVTLSAAFALAAPRVVTVGDVHGDLAAFKAILGQAGVLGPADAWTGGDAVLVQLGDLIDRGPSMRGTLDFVMTLEQAAAKGGGRVVALLGNHEVMNMTGDWRYVVPANYAEFADAGSEKRRDEAWTQVRSLRKRRAERLGQPEPASDAQAREAWLQAHPPGYIEHAEAFGSGGAYGRWLRSRPALFAAQASAFLHGGLAPAYAGTPLEEIDRRVHDDLAAYDADRQRFVAEGLILPFFDLAETMAALREELQALAAADGAARAAAEQARRPYETPAADAERRKTYQRFLDWSAWTINSADGPLWFRGYSEWTDAQGSAEMPRLLAPLRLERIVVGHTPQPGARIHARFGGAVFLIDTGMNAAYVPNGRGSALEIQDGTVSAISAGQPREVIWPAPAKAAAAAPARGRVFLGSNGQPLPFASDEQVLEFLREAKVVGVEVIHEGIAHARRLTLERDGVRAHAVFRTVHAPDPQASFSGGKGDQGFRDFYGFEPAAYRLGLLLGVDNIPPATLRRIEGEPGSVQIWIERAMTEKRRKDEKREPPERLLWQRRLQTRLVWDTLIGNTDRNQGNTLYTPDWQMWLIDHTRAFRAGGDLQGAEDIVWCERGLWERLRTVEDAAIRASVVENLKATEVAGLLERRRRLVDFLDRRIRERGESAVLFDWPS
jgi:Calcineurin-like phosphoesterase